MFERKFSEDSEKQKFYALSMFPYPSGTLHMGHVRVYSISDTIARFHKMTGKNVLHPMGWDAFGLPAENAALQRGLNPDDWTQMNIASMKESMEELNLGLDWEREFATCDSDYYKWTQYLFLKLHENGLVYQKKAFVNWDPIDKTVLADEQVDHDGKSWRSGAKVEKKLLKQWFIRTTRFSKRLYDGLDDPNLLDWRDIIKVQKHWIGECTGTNIDFEIIDSDSSIEMDDMTIWLRYPEQIDRARFVAVHPKSIWNVSSSSQLQPYRIKNPFTTDILPVYATNEVEYPEGAECHLGIPEVFEADKNFAASVGISPEPEIQNAMSQAELEEYRDKICAEARERGIGGDATSSKLRDWLISRQRYWGTPIPIVYCNSCGGPVPVAESDLPIRLPRIKKVELGKSALKEAKEWLSTTCPKCGGPATRETDTMDTFVDSSWYYLRFLDPDNVKIPFDVGKAKKFMPVDIYIGGKEHAALHLYFARFFSYFLHSAGLLPHREPFKRLLVQGLVRGQSFRVKSTGQYISHDMVEKVGEDSVHKETKEPLIVQWEKMSKSKFNGVEPKEMFEEFGVDTTKLIILADVSPTSSRNWSRGTFRGVLKWQGRMWGVVSKFIGVRGQNMVKLEDSEEFTKAEEVMFDTRNYFLKHVNFNVVTTYHLSVAISRLQALTNHLMKADERSMAFGPQFERALSILIIMLAPFAPHFASELWAGFVKAPNRICTTGEILWDKPVLLQPWPRIDSDYSLPVNVIIQNQEVCQIKVPKHTFDQLTLEDTMKLVFKNDTSRSRLSGVKIVKKSFLKHKDYLIILKLIVDAKKKKDESEDTKEGTEISKEVLQ